MSQKVEDCKPLLGGSLRRCGGQGDVLAGTIATFLAWTNAWWKASRPPPPPPPPPPQTSSWWSSSPPPPQVGRVNTVNRCSPRHRPHNVLVLATSSTIYCTGARHVIHYMLYPCSPRSPLHLRPSFVLIDAAICCCLPGPYRRRRWGRPCRRRF